MLINWLKIYLYSPVLSAFKFAFKSIYDPLKFKWDTMFCEHDFVYWDAILKCNNKSINGTRIKQKFKQCTKCEQKYKMITTPNCNGRGNFGRYVKTTRDLPLDQDVIIKVRSLGETNNESNSVKKKEYNRKRKIDKLNEI